MASSRFPSEPLGWSALVFAAILIAGGILIALGARETRRILETGTKSTATVISTSTDLKKRNHYVEVRIDDHPERASFRRLLRWSDWNHLRPGDRIPYTYDPSDPSGGVLEPEIEMRTDVAGWFAWGSVFVVLPAAGWAVLFTRERRRRAASSGG